MGGVIGDQVGIVDGGQEHPDDARNRRAADHIHLGTWVSPDREPSKFGDELVSHLLDRCRVVTYPRLPRSGIVEGSASTEQWQIRLEIVDPVKCSHYRENKLGVVYSVRDRLREGKTDLRE